MSQRDSQSKSENETVEDSKPANNDKDDSVVLEEDKKEVLRTSPQEMAKMIELVNAIKESGLFEENKEISQAFSGPLPPQVLNNLTSEQSDKIINDMVSSNQKSLDNQSKLMEKVFEDAKQSRVHKRIIIIISVLAGLGIISLLIFTKNNELLENLIGIGFAFLAGGGVFYNLSPKKKPPQHHKQDDDENL